MEKTEGEKMLESAMAKIRLAGYGEGYLNGVEMVAAKLLLDGMDSERVVKLTQLGHETISSIQHAIDHGWENGTGSTKQRHNMLATLSVRDDEQGA